MKRWLLGIVACGAAGFVIGRGPLASSSARPRADVPGCGDQRLAIDGNAPRLDRTLENRRDGAASPSPLDPRSARYDPTIASRILSRTASELWENEPRDEVFASRREQFLRGRFLELLRQLVPSASLEAVECRRGTCQIVLGAAGEEAQPLDAALGLVPFGDRFETSVPEFEAGRALLLVHVSYARERLDQAAFEQWFEALWNERWRLARERYERDVIGQSDGGLP